MVPRLVWDRMALPLAGSANPAANGGYKTDPRDAQGSGESEEEVMTVNVLPEPTKVATLLRELTASWIECVRDGDLLAVDTPFVLQDGHLFRAFISAGDRPGQVVVSDGGWASEQVELFTRTVSVRNARIDELKRIGREAGIQWDTEFAYTATDLQSAV